ncbi:MAG: ACP S-malonyltransferase [Candidatus Eisenbacteria bacterium]|nr:ACP S-malonyltransferase [Candidatus Eisenbacteria bacterium]MCC7144376.1 ACP S-malonyltransferase [Candidatus Eisenbacteria bacterium]
MSIGYLFPGQGSQFVGMGKDLYEKFPAARAVFDEANAVLGFDLARLCFEGPEEELKQTRNTQPAIFTHSIAAWRALGWSAAPSARAAGHSLGEYSAYVAAGAFDFAAGLRLVRRRGELMYQAGLERPGTMAAALGLEAARVAELLSGVSGTVRAANFNSPGQVVISGEVAAVEAAMEILKSGGAKRVIRLEVSGAFHSPLMESAATGLRAMLAETPMQAPRCPVVTNQSARPVAPDGADFAPAIRDSLERQLLSTVRWEESVRSMLADGITEFYEIGPGKVLAGLVRGVDKEAKVTPLGTAEQLEVYLSTTGLSTEGSAR